MNNETLKSWLETKLFWPAVVCGIAAGILAIVLAIIYKKYAAIAWGVSFIIASIIAAVSGAKGTPDIGISPPSVGAKFTNVSMAAIVAIFALFGASLVVTFIVPPWKR